MCIRWAIPVIACFLLIAGCGPKSNLPDLESVNGSVVRGSTPIERVYIKLVSETGELEQDFTIVGVTDSKGNFAIHTIEARTGRRVSGAPPGRYHVHVQVPMDENQRGGANFTLPNVFTVREGGGTIPTIDLTYYLKK